MAPKMESAVAYVPVVWPHDAVVPAAAMGAVPARNMPDHAPFHAAAVAGLPPAASGSVDAPARCQLLSSSGPQSLWRGTCGAADGKRRRCCSGLGGTNVDCGLGKEARPRLRSEAEADAERGDEPRSNADETRQANERSDTRVLGIELLTWWLSVWTRICV